VATVGLGPLAGALTLTVDTVGFAGRFFAEGMEDVDKRPEEALSALGATRFGIVFGAVVPGALPSFINTTLFSFERAVRSSVILGYVAAGGIGRLLEGPMTWMEYDKAATVILGIFALVLIGERASAYMRKRIMRHNQEGDFR
jgi:phosphonate transport system permease protein